MRWWPRGWWPLRPDPCTQQAVAAAGRKLAEVEGKDQEIRAVVDSLAALRRRNQFGPMIEEAFRRRRP